MNSFVIIGGGKSQIPFIKAAKKLAYNTVVFDQNPDAQGAVLADIFHTVSTHDYESIAAICAQLNSKTKLQGIITYSAFGKPLITVARLCCKYGLPSFSEAAAELALDKRQMKKKFAESKLPIPESIITGNLAAAEEFIDGQALPFIVKPGADTRGSSGVSLLQDIIGLPEVFRQAADLSSNDSVIIEKYYEAREFSVDGIVQAGWPTILAVSEKFNLGFQENFIMSGFATGRVPKQDHLLKEYIYPLRETALQAVKSLGIDNSFFSVDLLLTKTGPLLLEAGIMLDAKIDRLLHFADIDVYEMFCRIAAGKLFTPPAQTFSKGFALSFMFARQEGILNIFSDDTSLKSISADQRYLIEWETKDGAKVKLPESIADNIGWIITEGEDVNQAYANAVIISQKPFFKIS
jgi:biotin carboxylase